MPTSSDVAVLVQGLSKRYRIGAAQQSYRTFRETLSRGFKQMLRPSAGDEELWALRDVTFEVRKGSVLGIIGRNGAGKSTLLKVLSRITEPTAGRAELRGRVASLLEVGTGFHPELTGRENIFLNAAILGMTRAEVRERFDAIVAFSGVERFLETPVKHYSSGMYMRLAFAVAAHLEPDVLLIDEVLAVGDIEFQKKCLGKMEEVARQGRTVLFVSHNLGAVSTLCNAALWLQHGKALQPGSVPETLAAYRASLANEEGTGAKGSSQLRVTSIRVVSGGQGGVFGPFDPCSVEARFVTERELTPAEINLHVQDPQGRHTIHLRTDFDGLYPTFAPGEHWVKLQIEALHLESQVYFFWLRIVGRNPLTIADSEAIPVEVRAPWDRHGSSQPVVAVRRKWDWDGRS